MVYSSHPASFRFHLTMDTLAFGYILPTTGRIRDFNPLETCAARRTAQKRPCKDAGARRIAPRTARFDGFVKHRNPSSIISYSILPTKRSTRDSACATAVPAAAPLTTSKIYSSRFFILFTLIRIVDPLCKSAVVVGGSTPATPRAISPELKPTIFR